MHFDHIGGNTKIVKGKLEPVFPNAIYWMQKENWNLANSTSERDNGSFLKDDWSILQENEMITIGRWKRIISYKYRYRNVLRTYNRYDDAYYPRF